MSSKKPPKTSIRSQLSLKRPSISKFFDGAVTHVKSALQFPLTTVTAIAEKEMSSKRDKSPARQKLSRKEARSETPHSSNSRNLSFTPLKHKLTRREARSETTHSSNDRNLAVTPAQINLYPIIDGSPEDRAVESDMIDIGFYASIGYPVNRSLAMDGGADTPLDNGNVGTPRHKLQNRNATVMPTPPMSEGIGPRHVIPPRKSHETPTKPDVASPGIKSYDSSRHESFQSSYETDVTSLPALQTTGGVDDHVLEPLGEDDEVTGSYDLLGPTAKEYKRFNLEERSELLFSTDHLRIIFGDPALLLRFTSFLSSHRPDSVPILIYYLDAIKALKAISYANAITEALEPIDEHEFTRYTVNSTSNQLLEEKAREAFQVMVNRDLPAYITHTYVQTVSLSISMRIAGTLPVHLRQASEGLAEVFCLTDPSRPDNPIVFASEEFHRTTQYGMNYVLGRNCRFLQGPKTNQHTVARFRQAVREGKEHVEVFLNYRRDGSPFMNLLMFAPLRDSRGTIRYFIGAQVDVSGLVKECSDLDSLRRLAIAKEKGQSLSEEQMQHTLAQEPDYKKDEFQQLSEMMNMQELETVRRWGGRMHRERAEAIQDEREVTNWNKQRVLIQESGQFSKKAKSIVYNNGTLNGVYENYLLVRPYPSLKILFASPSMRVPGILQSPFMGKIGGSPRVREELTQALADGRGVTAKIRWVTKQDTEGRSRWIHCTALLGSNGAIGVWMVVIVDDDRDGPQRRYRQAPPVDLKHGQNTPSARDSEINSLRDFALVNGGWEHPSMKGLSTGTSNNGSFAYTPGNTSINGDEHSESGYKLV